MHYEEDTILYHKMTLKISKQLKKSKVHNLTIITKINKFKKKITGSTRSNLLCFLKRLKE